MKSPSMLWELGGASPRLVAASLCLLAASASACVPSLQQHRSREPEALLSGSFAGSQTTNTVFAEAQSAAQKTWREFFPDPELQELIAGAIAHNQELMIRLQELIIAKAEVMSRQGDYMPRLGVGAGAGVEKVGRHTRLGVLDDRNGIPKNLQNYELAFTASWEVDIWKKLRNAAQAANLRYLASVEGRNFLITQLVAEVARSYYELLALDNQLEVLRSNVEIQANALELMKLEKQAARVTQLAVSRFEAEVLKNQSRQYELEQERIEAENRINFLLARPPQPVKRDPEKFKGQVPDLTSAGVPAQLLDNRPDVRQAVLELEAAKLDVKSAKAAFYPSLRIDADLGYQAFNVKHLLTTPESLLYNVAGGLTAPLLNRRAIAAQYSTASALQIQAVIQYERTVLQAYTEVVNSLTRVGNLQKGYELQSQQVQKLSEAIDISSILFQAARADYTEVLFTRRDTLEAQMELIETKSQQMQARVNVYQVLGGGWR
jgi:outer membrane protein, multidrug efflux system